MEARLSILFYGKKNKLTSENLLPIYLRVTIDGRRFEVSTQRFVEQSKWSSQSGKVKGNAEEARAINIYLDSLRQRVYQYQKEITQDAQQFNTETLRLRWFGIGVQSYKLLEVFRHHNSQMEKLIGIDFERPTYVKFNTTLEHTATFIRWKYNISDMDITQLSYSFLTDFEFWLKSEKKCNHNTTLKYLSNLRKIVNGCIKNGWLDKDPFFGYKMSKKEVIIEVLTNNELRTIMSKDFKNLRLNQVKDILIFSCYTGFAYVDAQKLKRHEICVGVDGAKWIYTSRKKTDTSVRVPLLPPVLDIIERYADHPKCISTGSLLPIPSNQKLNSYLKEIADVCGINKNLTFHMARHTFATTVLLTNGVPIETVSKLLGHKSIKITQHYAKLLDTRVSEDMLVLKNKLAHTNNANAFG